MDLHTSCYNKLFRFGTAYYPDYIQVGHLGRTLEGKIAPLSFDERLQSDFQRMKRAGIQEIRMGEFAWSSLEPSPNNFQADRFLAALDLAHQNGISVYFCTPTATPPKWLIDQYPDILPIDAQGRTHNFGSRRHYDPCSPVFREHSRRITHYVAKTFGTHPAVVAWQVDNELGHHGTHECRSEAARLAFQQWLEKTYDHDIEKLNRDWFSCFWSQNYRSFKEIDIPMYTWAGVGPHIEMAYRRFYNEVYRSFQAEQIEILREHSPKRLITTNLISNFYDLCPWNLTADLDFVGFDHYQDDPYPQPQRSAVNFTLMRSLKQQRFKVLEQQPVQVNWQKINRRFSFDWLWLWAIQAASYGADTMHYFSWQRFSGGPEQYHDAVLPHDLRVPQSNQEKVLAASHQFFLICQQKLGWSDLPEPKVEVLIVHSSESLWSHRICSQSEYYDATIEVDRMAKICYSLGLGFQFCKSLPTDQSSLNGIKLIILPGYAFDLTDEEIAVLKDCMKNGTWVLSFPRTAMKRPDQHMSPLPCSITDQNSYYFQEYGAMGPEEAETVNLGSKCFVAERWIEKIVISPNSSYQALAEFSDGLYKNSPAIIKRSIGKGGHFHFAFCPKIDDEFINWFASEFLSSPRLVLPEKSQCQAVPLISGSAEWIILLNFGQEALDLPKMKAYQLRLSCRLGVDLELHEDLSQEFEAGFMTPRAVYIFQLL